MEEIVLEFLEIILVGMKTVLEEREVLEFLATGEMKIVLEEDQIIMVLLCLVIGEIHFIDEILHVLIFYIKFK